MSKRIGAVAGVLLSLAAVAPGLVAQTPRNPISTKPEGSGPSCSYTGSINDGKPSSTSACSPGATPGTDPNLILPKSPAQQFPFPGDSPATLTPDTPASQNPATPAVPQSSAPTGNPAKQFPFPGDTPAADIAPAPTAPSSTSQPDSASPLRDAGSSGSSSSSSSSQDSGFSSSSANPDGSNLPDDDPNAPLPTPHHNARKKLPPPTKPLTQDEKEAEDVQVAGFYQNDGNYKAAYERSKEAVSLVADDADAHLALADAARKLGKLDEAEQNYKRTLALDPVPKTRKAAERALKEMSGS